MRANAEFNARDYYPVEGAWEKAKAERVAFCKELHRASEHFLRVAEAAQEYIDAREARAAKAAGPAAGGG